MLTKSTQNTTEIVDAKLDLSPDNQEHGKEVPAELAVVQANQGCPNLWFSVFIARACDF